MSRLVAIGLGGAAGSILRYLVIAGTARLLRASFPYGTLVVNVTGSVAVGLILGWASGRGGMSEVLRGFVVIGFLGGFTTFSAFSAETVGLVENGSPGLALLYAVLSVTLATLAAGVGLVLGRALPS